ncbi:Dimer_Tnp_hAT domain-containing protein/DUF4371 domain-containing protein [Cephalotus follicularis]|uniref:Dimer_Tnp_hAT domain-containing protein/DUF4371 domain-containing protein n=1 Tax=Cephalotus follicularis TaxID=3775 RepID=A0A1Q3AM58_CEPFO|nr:Dimer_Tnp_hAT domain-containing protein/DUF4371 domain-containing protein [Cephalotus follicularis]
MSHNRLKLKASVDAVRWLTFQNCPLRGNDKSIYSINIGNFIEMVKLLASYNEDVKNIVLDNAPQNAQYIAPSIQKEILHVIARKVRCVIREKISDAKFCILVDESRDESKREKMAIVLRYVDKVGIVQERFFDLVHVPDTSALTLKNEITIAELSHGLVKTEKYEIYHLVFKLIRLVLTLPVSTAITERSFSAIKIVETRLRNKIEDEYLTDYLVTYIEKRTATQFSTDSIIDDFYDVKECRARLR